MKVNMKLKILTWNINNTCNIYYDLNELISSQMDENLDLFCISLQEVCNFEIKTFKKFYKNSNYKNIELINSVSISTLIISKHEFTVKSNHLLFGKFYVNKGAIISKIKVNEKILIFVNLHLECMDKEVRRRRQQLKFILFHIQKDSRYPIILSGDFNFRMHGLRDEGDSFLKKNLFLDEPKKLQNYTYKYINHTRILDNSRTSSFTDRVLFSGNFVVKEYKTLDNHISDHLPVLSYMELKNSNSLPFIIKQKYGKYTETSETFFNYVLYFLILFFGVAMFLLLRFTLME